MALSFRFKARPSGLLVRPPDLMQELASGVEMGRHVEAPLNHLHHSLGGPQFCAVAIGNGSLKQDPDQPMLLAARKSLGRPCCRQCSRDAGGGPRSGPYQSKS
jgi:hypothetical protein